MSAHPPILLSSGFPAATLAALREQFDVTSIDDPAEALDHLRQAPELPLAVVIGLVGREWPQTDGSPGDLPAHLMLEEILGLDRDLPVIISTGRRHPAAIVEMIKRGGFDYVVEMHHLDGATGLAAYTQDLLFALRRAVQWRRTVLENRQLKREWQASPDPAPATARSPQMLRLMELVRKVAPTPATVLISGESGVGKEVVARTIHTLSPRRDEPFVAINCGALTEPLLNSELFGHVRGAFTGADTDRPGLIRQAAGGTLLLDEIATLSPAFQVTLLRVLEERRARPVGGQAEYHVQCRFIAAANRRLETLVQDGTFREDLYYRLHVFHLHVPPLRDRRDDIPVLAFRFLQDTARAFGKDIVGFEPSAMAILEHHPWPGNVRQLRNLIERAVILCDGQRIRRADLHPGGDLQPDAIALPAATDADYHQAMQRFETQLLRRTLQRTDGNVSAAARQLNLKRTTLAHRLKHLHLR
jgi:DNA-binding NtrC family response regulator